MANLVTVSQLTKAHKLGPQTVMDVLAKSGLKPVHESMYGRNTMRLYDEAEAGKLMADHLASKQPGAAALSLSADVQALMQDLTDDLAHLDKKLTAQAQEVFARVKGVEAKLNGHMGIQSDRHQALIAAITALTDAITAPPKG